MIKPTIHLNGTSPERLFEGYINAYRAVDAAIEALANVEFHSRDYRTVRCLS
jgi:ferritin